MMRPSAEMVVYVCVAPVDFRLQINGLASCVQEVLGLAPLSAHLFAFTNRHRNRVKVLYWERNGFVLWHKRLERDRFQWPRGDESTVSLTGQELNWLLDGFDLRYWRPHGRLDYQWVA
jgi:transposase